MDLPDWPPPSRECCWYLHPDGGLGPGPAPEAVTQFRYDPADPTPTVGGRLLLSGQSGYREDTALAERPDVLGFTSAPLDSALLVCGTPVLELDHGNDGGHFDVFGRISEVDRRGRSRNVSDGYRRFSAAPEGTIRLELDPIAHRFSPGSRLRVLIAGGSHPRFARNLGTGEPVVSGRRMVPSTHRVRHGESSRLILPVAESV